VDLVSGHVFVANSADNTVTMLDARTGRVLHTTAVGGDPEQLQINPHTARTFVLNQTDGSVSVLDTRTGAVLHTLRLGAALAPGQDQRSRETFAFDSFSGTRSSVAVPESGLEVVQDAPQGTRLWSSAFSLPGWGLAVDGPAARLFVPAGANDTVALYDAARGTYLRAIRVRARPVPSPWTRRRGVPSWPAWARCPPRTRRAVSACLTAAAAAYSARSPWAPILPWWLSMCRRGAFSSSMSGGPRLMPPRAAAAEALTCSTRAAGGCWPRSPWAQ
jgi:YVTN family beta-propeller protein